MFVDAFALAEHFTRPIVISTRRLNGKVESAVATYVLLNADGWFLTAGHVFEERDVVRHAGRSTSLRAASWPSDKAPNPSAASFSARREGPDFPHLLEWLDERGCRVVSDARSRSAGVGRARDGRVGSKSD